MYYLICQDWWNTSKNHAGIKYLCLYLEQNYPTEFKSVVITKKRTKLSNSFIVNKFRNFKFKLHQWKISNAAASKLISQLSSDDKVILMEYFDVNVNQYIIAKKIRKKYPNILIYAMSHLVPLKIDQTFPDKLFLKWQRVVDVIITLGSSLTDYYKSRGVSDKKLMTTFHYVDDFYLKHEIIKHKNFTVIAMGNQMRDVNLLSEIVKSNPDVNFIICQGVNDLSKMFTMKNVELVPFVSENELLDLMKSADVSLNVMYDTIGSNVIVTSLGMGLAMLCSDVGSIRDYCDENNTIFCKTLDDFNSAIQFLKSNPDKLMLLRHSSKEKALNYTIEKFYNTIKML